MFIIFLCVYLSPSVLFIIILFVSFIIASFITFFLLLSLSEKDCDGFSDSLWVVLTVVKAVMLVVRVAWRFFCFLVDDSAGDDDRDSGGNNDDGDRQLGW